jgi:glucans biosynthesis protein
LLRTGVSLPLLALADNVVAADTAPASMPFDGSTVRTMARQLALQPFKAPDTNLPASIKDLSYDAYPSIRFDPGKSLWMGQKRKFTAQFFHRGYIYHDRVDIF